MRIGVVVVVAALAGSARAGDRGELLGAAGEELGVFYQHLRRLTRSGTTSGQVPTADQCDTAVRAWREKGVKDDDRISSFEFNAHPKAEKNAIPFGEMDAICAAYRPLYTAYKVARDLSQYDGVLMKIRDGLVKPGDSTLSAYLISQYEKDGDPAGCKAAVASARALDPSMRSKGISGHHTLDEYETRVCDELARLHPPWVAEARAALRRNTEKKMAPYVAAGIGGKKLELMIQYDGVYWRLPGGIRTDDPKTLAKASTLFHWLEAEERDDPRYIVHTIRKYRFNGNDLAGVSEKTYRLDKSAQLGDVFR